MAKRSKKKKKSGSPKQKVKSLIQPPVVRFKPIQMHEGISSQTTEPVLMEDIPEELREAYKVIKRYDYELHARVLQKDFLLHVHEAEEEGKTFPTIEEALEYAQMDIIRHITEDKYLYDIASTLRRDLLQLLGEEQLLQLVRLDLIQACREALVKVEVDGQGNVDELVPLSALDNVEFQEKALEWISEESFEEVKKRAWMEEMAKHYLVSRMVALYHTMVEFLPLNLDPTPATAQLMESHITRESDLETSVELLGEHFHAQLPDMSLTECQQQVRQALLEDEKRSAHLPNPFSWDALTPENVENREV